MERNKCIYCGASKSLCRQAHAIPRSLGTFKNQPSLKNRVCRECDSKIGKGEEQLIKCGPEAFIRIALGITGRSGKKSTSPFRRAHAGHEALKFKAKYPGTHYEVLVEIIPGTQNWRPLPQIVIVDSNGSCEQILINEDNMTVEHIDKLIGETKLKGELRIWSHGTTDEEQERIFNLLRKSKHTSNEFIDENIRPCNENVPAVGTIVVDKQYFRAIAKIAFHYFLCNYDGFDGEESSFEPIRRFIRYDEGEVKTFVHQKRGNLVADLNRGYRPKYYGHFLICKIEKNRIYGYVQLFIGKDIDPGYYLVDLGTNPRRIILSPERFGHFYVYYEPENRRDYHGEIQELAATVNIIIPNPPYKKWY